MTEEKNVGEGTATVAKVKIKGVSGASIDPIDVVITLADVQFASMSAGTTVTSWFTNRPGNLIAKVKNAVTEGDTTITITVSGTPANWATAALL
jgi:hypothetical protein